MLGLIVSLLLSGLIIGALARFAVPGPDPLSIWKTILLGILGSFLGGLVAGALGLVDTSGELTGGEAATGFLCALGGAVLLLILYRRFVQGRSITGPDAR